MRLCERVRRCGSASSGWGTQRRRWRGIWRRGVGRPGFMVTEEALQTLSGTIALLELRMSVEVGAEAARALFAGRPQGVPG